MVGPEHGRILEEQSRAAADDEYPQQGDRQPPGDAGGPASRQGEDKDGQGDVVIRLEREPKVRHDGLAGRAVTANEVEDPARQQQGTRQDLRSLDPGGHSGPDVDEADRRIEHEEVRGGAARSADPGGERGEGQGPDRRQDHRPEARRAGNRVAQR